MLRSKLLIRKSLTGLGLFSNENIKRGERITQYLGKIISTEEANKKPNRYIFKIDTKFSLDGSSRYNLARYINHSCKPNAIAVSYPKARQKIYIEAKKKIYKGEEITIDYGKEYFQKYLIKKGCRCFSCRQAA